MLAILDNMFGTSVRSNSGADLAPMLSGRSAPPRKVLGTHRGKCSAHTTGSGTVPLWFCPAASTCHARTTPDWSILLFGEGNVPTLPPSFSFRLRSRGRRRHCPCRGCLSSCEASQASGRLRAIQLAICIRCSCGPPPLNPTRIFW